MNKKTFFLLISLILSIPLGEVWQLFHVPELRERNWFIASNVKQDIEWYVKDTCEALAWIIFLTVWYIREKERSKIFSRYIAAFLGYRVLDLIFYWYNHRAASGGYVICYFLLLSGILTIYTKKK